MMKKNRVNEKGDKIGTPVEMKEKWDLSFSVDEQGKSIIEEEKNKWKKWSSWVEGVPSVEGNSFLCPFQPERKCGNWCALFHYEIINEFNARVYLGCSGIQYIITKGGEYI